MEIKTKKREFIKGIILLIITDCHKKDNVHPPGKKIGLSSLEKDDKAYKRER